MTNILKLPASRSSIISLLDELGAVLIVKRSPCYVNYRLPTGWLSLSSYYPYSELNYSTKAGVQNANVGRCRKHNLPAACGLVCR